MSNKYISNFPSLIKETPKIVFIIPYRNRPEQLDLLIRNYTYILSDLDTDDYQIFIIEQDDDKPFNRGGVKNMGFTMVKTIYPNSYSNITLIFNDVDTMFSQKVSLKMLRCIKNKIKHFYGFSYALGGIFGINCKIFETIKGFPNFWGWGFEDNILNTKLVNSNYNIDRTNFHNIKLNKDKNNLFIHHLHDGPMKNTSNQKYQFKEQTYENNLKLIEIEKYEIEEKNIYYLNDNNNINSEKKEMKYYMIRIKKWTLSKFNYTEYNNINNTNIHLKQNKHFNSLRSPIKFLM